MFTSSPAPEVAPGTCDRAPSYTVQNGWGEALNVALSWHHELDVSWKKRPAIQRLRALATPSQCGKEASVPGATCCSRLMPCAVRSRPSIVGGLRLTSSARLLEKV